MGKALKRLFRSNYLFTAGVVICLFWIAAAILAPVIAPYDPSIDPTAGALPGRPRRVS